MLCSIYFSLYRVPTLLTPFSSPEVATTLTTLLMCNNCISMYETCMSIDETLMCIDDTFMCMDKTYG
jgi:hypothetical protein